jgi:hypothetical protein
LDTKIGLQKKLGGANLIALDTNLQKFDDAHNDIKQKIYGEEVKKLEDAY